ncbi:MAG: glycine cleavage system protein [Pseudomonadota bacterium]|mgnify:FL=1|jgi:glycine cleavage system H protein
MSETRYSKDHEYIRVEGDVGIVGISDYAQSQLGDVVFVELPATGKALSKGAEAAVVESVKAASEVYAPVSGEVTAVNSALEKAPGTINEDPQGEGWFMKIKLSNPSELGDLMSEADYKTYLASL